MTKKKAEEAELLLDGIQNLLEAHPLASSTRRETSASSPTSSFSEASSSLGASMSLRCPGQAPPSPRAARREMSPGVAG